MRTVRDPILDFHGQIMFFCGACGEPLTHDDFYEIGLRLPDQGETRDDYCEAELIDKIEHVDCLRSARTG